MPNFWMAEDANNYDDFWVSSWNSTLLCYVMFVYIFVVEAHQILFYVLQIYLLHAVVHEEAFLFTLG